MRDQNAIRPTREIMIERMKRYGSQYATGPVKLPETLLRLCIDGKIRVSRSGVFLNQLFDAIELSFTIR